MTDWTTGPEAMRRHRVAMQAARTAMEKEGVEFIVEHPYKGDSELSGGGIDELLWNGKPVVAFIAFPKLPSDPVALALVVHTQDDGEFTVVRVSRRNKNDAWFGFSFVSDLSWADVRRFIHEDMDI